MGGGIYLIQNDETLVEMTEQDYDSEDLLQGLLARYPNLLAGDQMGGDDPRRWLLVTRELGVPGEKGADARWSLDHLFLDQDGVPTLVEVKRSSDTRIRREVVGQMLDYAANGVAYWPPGELRQQLSARLQKLGQDPEQILADFLGPERSAEEFWQEVERNLRQGTVRMLFVADEIPVELRRVVEFLNEQMQEAEVLAVEVKQFVGQGLRTLVPRVFGATARVDKPVAGNSRRRQWDERTFLEALDKSASPAARDVARKLLEWSKRSAPWVRYGSGQLRGSFLPSFAGQERDFRPFSVWTDGRMQIQFGYFDPHPALSSDEFREELARRLREESGLAVPPHLLHGFPEFDLAVLSQPESLERFLAIIDWARSLSKGASDG